MAANEGVSGGPPSGLREFVAENHHAIIDAWAAMVRTDRKEAELPRLHLLDNMPEILSELGKQLGDGSAGGLGHLPEMHAIERLELGFDLHEVVREYAALRECIIRLYARQPGRQVSFAEFVDLGQAIDGAVAVAIDRYVAERQRTLDALNRISLAALEDDDVDRFLDKILHVLVETVSALDMAMIFLWDGERLRPHAQFGLDLDVEEGLSLRLGEGFAGKVAEERCVQALRSAASSTVVRSRAIHKLGTRALFGLPLIERGKLIGVAYMGSTTAFEFSAEDQLLFRTAASRAAALIAQAQLLVRERAFSAQLDAVMRASPAGIALLDASFRYVRCNEALANQNGTTVAETLGKSVFEVAPDLAPRLEPLFRDILRTGRAYTDVEISGRRGAVLESSGSWLASYHPVPMEDGSTGIGAVIMEITARKATERALAASEARLKGWLMAALDAVVVIDRDSRVMEWNPAAEETFGYSRGRAVGRLLPDLIIPPELREEHLRGLRKYLAGGVGKFIGRRVEVPAIRADGTRIQVELAITEVRAGGAHTFMGFVRDISERKEAEREREQFVAVLSHDLRSPLTAISASAATLQRRAETEPMKSAAARISASADRMGRMIFDLLDVTRSRHGGGLPISPREVDVAGIARQIVEELRSAAPEREIRLHAEGDLHARLDGDRIIQALNNLLSNALAYGLAGTPIELSARGDAEAIELQVTNQGPPVPENLLPELWEPFRRGIQQRQGNRAGGLGLGLYIVKQIARAHGGDATGGSAGGVTTFTLRLPRRAPEERA